MAKRRIDIAKADIVRLFHDSGERIFTHNTLGEILEANRSFWRLAQATRVKNFIDYLIDKTEMKRVRLAFPKRPIIRYTWGKVPSFEVIQSIDSAGYFSHYTGLRLHSLTEQLPKRAYFNIEQLSSGQSSGLSQNSINRAFRARCRQSNKIAPIGDHEVCLINSKNSENLGVISMDTEFGDGIRVTSVERALIDAAVRPVYCGGVSEVARAFELAHGRVSINRMAAYLRKLSYAYPYHQSIGYYLSRAGVYKQSQIDLLRRFPIEFDFYLNYQLKNPDYNKKWRLYVPKGF